MKRFSYIFIAALLGLFSTACVDEQGSEPGTDPYPKISCYQYAPSSDEYNTDECVRVKLVSNGNVSEGYYLTELSKEKEAFIAQQGEEAYMQKVISSGQKITFASNGEFETVITGLPGFYDITAVAVNGGAKRMSATQFQGLAWKPGKKGTYYFQNANIQAVAGESATVELQQCESDANLYRFKDIWGEGTGMKIRLLPDYTAKDADGTYTYFRVPAQSMPFYITDKRVNVRDIGYWQGNDAFVTDHGYESGMYEDGYCFVYVQYYISGKNLGYQYDYFVPAS